MPDLRERLQAAFGAAYALERELDGAGMSRVFVATETALGRQVVIKVMPPELAADVRVERFRREIQLAARLQHPHIIAVLTSGEADGLIYYTMPLADGETLRARLARDYQLDPPEAARIWRDVLEALAYAHDRGIVHRDIKPDNIILSHGHALVTDFGVAKAVSTAAGTDTPFTASGVVVGTPAYMSPEQATAEPDVDHRADIYSAGIVMYEMLAGQPPFSGRSARTVLEAQAERRPVPVEERREGLSPALAALINKCLAKRPDDRPPLAGAVIASLDAASSAVRSTPARPMAAAEMLRRFRPRPRMLSRAFLGAMAVGLAAGVIAGAMHQRNTPAPASRAGVIAERDVTGAGDPPPPTAFLEFRDGLAASRQDREREAAAHFARALAIDDRFTQASLQLAWSLWRSGEGTRADSVLGALRASGATLTPIELAQWATVRAAIAQDQPAMLAGTRRLVAIAGPASPLYDRWFIAALTANDQPREARSVLERLGPSPDDSAVHQLQLAELSHFLKDYRAQLAAARAWSRDAPRARSQELIALAALDSAAALRAFLDGALAGPNDDPARVALAVSTARELRVHGQAIFADSLLESALRWYAAHAGAAASVNAVAHAGALLDAGRPRDALRAAGGAIAVAGCAHAMLRDSAAALRISKRLAAVGTPDDEGARFAARARIAALLGEREQAVALLRQAFAHGATFDLRLSLHSDPAFASLRGYAPFESLLAPAG